MTVNCAACGVAMASAEVTARPYDGVAGNYHRDCAYDEYLLNAGPAKVNPSLATEIAVHKDKLNKKHLTISTPTPAAPTGTPVSGAGLGIGVYKYAVTFVDAYGETTPGTQATVTTTSGNQKVNLTAIPTGPASTSTVPLTTKRNLYRTAVGGSQLKFLATISDNTTTTYADTTADGSLGANAPAASTYAIADFP